MHWTPGFDLLQAQANAGQDKHKATDFPFGSRLRIHEGKTRKTAMILIQQYNKVLLSAVHSSPSACLKHLSTRVDHMLAESVGFMLTKATVRTFNSSFGIFMSPCAFNLLLTEVTWSRSATACPPFALLGFVLCDSGGFAPHKPKPPGKTAAAAAPGFAA